MPDDSGITHELQILSEHFQAILDDRKRFEVREPKPGRQFCVRDVLHLNEWDKMEGKYTGRSTTRRVTYVTKLRNGTYILSLGPVL